jgi:glutathione peroxidase
MSSVYDFECKLNNGEVKSLGDYKNDVMLIVNTASECGFTKQYKGLEELHKSYEPQGLKVLGFPCNQFGQQEPGDSQAIAEFCELKFGVTFDLFDKIDVNGDDTAPLFSYLKDEAKGLLGTRAVKWNFTKFLVNREGKVLKRYAPKDTPESMKSDIEALL